MSDYWTENGLIKPQQIVVCAAIKMSDGTILCGVRHWDRLMRKQVSHLEACIKEVEQGFIDQFGEFLTREEAMKIVKVNGQPFNIDRNGDDSTLFSEGLY